MLIDGMNTDVHAREPGRPYLLLVHGFLSSRAQWRPNLSSLSSVCNPVTVELLGHGRSAAPSDTNQYSVPSYLARFEKLRSSLDVSRWVVCGQSFGAGLTMRYAIEYPERIVGQVFTNSISALATVSSTDGQRKQRAAAIESGGHSALRQLFAYPKPSRRLPPCYWQDLVTDAELLAPIGIANTLRTTAKAISVAADLTRTRVASLLVNGARESAFQPLRHGLSRELPHLTIVDVEGGGHSVNIDSADEFNTSVVRFISHWLRDELLEVR
jgi:2-succinyl-6-hydroxy-2,4-cyclohexadiene-1-carboxylate synthase